MGKLSIGISGWLYPGWRGDFYPHGLSQRHELQFAARHFNTIEINASFYRLGRPEHYATWYEQTAPGFVFAVKGGRFITHFLQLRGIEVALANFFASGVLGLSDKLGPILWQFPQRLTFDERFPAFLAALPRDTLQAAALARRHDPRLRGRALIRSRPRQIIRHAVEVRSPSFCRPELVALLREQGVALVVADTAGRFPLLEDVTADFVYVRLHGDEKLYESGYTPESLARWAERIELWSRGSEAPDARRVSRVDPARRASRDVYVYFDNDVKVRAPYDALALARLLARRGARV